MLHRDLPLSKYLDLELSMLHPPVAMAYAPESLGEYEESVVAKTCVGVLGR